MPMAIVEQFFSVDVGIGGDALIDLTRALGKCQMGTEASGRTYFDFPEPFAPLRIYQHERIRGAKRERLLVALECLSTPAES
jgi:hypothetical protein